MRTCSSTATSAEGDTHFPQHSVAPGFFDPGPKPVPAGVNGPGRAHHRVQKLVRMFGGRLTGPSSVTGQQASLGLLRVRTRRVPGDRKVRHRRRSSPAEIMVTPVTIVIAHRSDKSANSSCADSKGSPAAVCEHGWLCTAAAIQKPPRSSPYSICMTGSVNSPRTSDLHPQPACRCWLGLPTVDGELCRYSTRIRTL